MGRSDRISNGRKDFSRAAVVAPRDLYDGYAVPKALTHFDNTFDELFQNLQTICAKAPSVDSAEPQIRRAFFSFLEKMDYPIASKNFEALLNEKSGDKTRRNDGTISWYHEFIPILTFMSLVRMGRNNGGIDMEALEVYGGLQTAITTHLRHDSIEDHTSIKRFKNQQMAILERICHERPDYDPDSGLKIIRMVLTNTNLMTQKKKILPNGEIQKEDVIQYTARMIDPKKQGNPVVFMLKQLDIIHNFSTLFGATKFDPEKRLKRCNEREDMYGPRHGFTDIAIHQWPAFSKGISTLDCIMGTLLYPQFRYLENVDLHYKTPSSHPVGIFRYLRKALSIPYPDERLNPVHEGFKRMANSVDPVEDPIKHKRLSVFMDKVIKAALLDREPSFPYLFFKERSHRISNDNGHPTPASRLS